MSRFDDLTSGILGDNPQQQNTIQPSKFDSLTSNILDKPKIGIGTKALNTVQALGAGLSNLPTYAKGYAANLAEGTHPLAENNTFDQWAQESSKLGQQQQSRQDANDPTLFGTKGEWDQTMQSMPFSLGSMGGALAGGFAGDLAGGGLNPLSSYAGAAAASGALAHRADSAMFMRNALEGYANKYKQDNNGAEPSQQDLLAEQERLQPYANEHGLWEAVPEAVGAPIGAKLVGSVFKPGGNVLYKGLKAAAGIAAEEIPTEVVTQHGQNNTEIDAGVHDGEKRSFTNLGDIGKSFNEVAVPVIQQSALMGGGATAVKKAYDYATGGPLTRASAVTPDAPVVEPTQPEATVEQPETATTTEPPVSNTDAPVDANVAPVVPSDTGNATIPSGSKLYGTEEELAQAKQRAAQRTEELKKALQVKETSTPEDYQFIRDQILHSNNSFEGAIQNLNKRNAERSNTITPASPGADNQRTEPSTGEARTEIPGTQEGSEVTQGTIDQKLTGDNNGQITGTDQGVTNSSIGATDATNLNAGLPEIDGADNGAAIPHIVNADGGVDGNSDSSNGRGLPGDVRGGIDGTGGISDSALGDNGAIDQNSVLRTGVELPDELKSPVDTAQQPKQEIQDGKETSKETPNAGQERLLNAGAPENGASVLNEDNTGTNDTQKTTNTVTQAESVQPVTGADTIGIDTTGQKEEAEPVDEDHETNFRLNSSEIRQELIKRGDIKKLFKAAKVNNSDSFSKLPISDQAKAYSSFISSGNSPVKVSQNYNDKVVKNEHDAIVRRKQSEAIIKADNGKPFKTPLSVKQHQDKYDLGISHDFYPVKAGFVLKRSPDATQEEKRRILSGKESYIEAQNAIVKQLGIKENSDGDLDVSDAEFEELQKLVKARLQSQGNSNPVESNEIKTQDQNETTTIPEQPIAQESKQPNEQMAIPTNSNDTVAQTGETEDDEIGRGGNVDVKEAQQAKATPKTETPKQKVAINENDVTDKSIPKKDKDLLTAEEIESRLQSIHKQIQALDDISKPRNMDAYNKKYKNLVDRREELSTRINKIKRESKLDENAKTKPVQPEPATDTGGTSAADVDSAYRQEVLDENSKKIKVFHHTKVDINDFDWSNFSRGDKRISQFGDGLSASTETNKSLISKYGKAIHGYVDGAKFINIDTNNSASKVWNDLKLKGFEFSDTYDEDFGPLNDNPGDAALLFNDFKENNPSVPGVKVINHIIGNEVTPPFYVIYKPSEFYRDSNEEVVTNGKGNARFSADAVTKILDATSGRYKDVSLDTHDVIKDGDKFKIVKQSNINPGVGASISVGETRITSSGRRTTPFPQDKAGGKKQTVWIIENALLEAQSRGDDFNARTFKADLDSAINSKSKRQEWIPQASKDSAEEYLFGEQPNVIPSITKPLVSTPIAQIQEKQPEPESKQEDVVAENVAESDKKAVRTENKELIGKGSSGEVFKIGNEVEKKSTNDEAKVYGLLSGVEGIAKGYEVNGKIRTPYYKNIISVDTIKYDDRKGLAGLISKSVERINHAVSELTNTGYYYNDPLQFGMNEDHSLDLIDFSMATNKEGDRVLNDNLSLLASFYKQFGLTRQAEAVSQVKEVITNQHHHVKYGTNALLGDEFDGVNYKELTDRLDGKKANNAYYTTNARYVNIKDTAQTDNINGIKTILSVNKLSDKDIKGWELVPVHEQANTEATVETDNTPLSIFTQMEDAKKLPRKEVIAAEKAAQERMDASPIADRLNYIHKNYYSLVQELIDRKDDPVKLTNCKTL